MFEQLRSVRQRSSACAALAPPALRLLQPSFPSPRRLYPSPRCRVRPVLVQARCHNIHFWDVGCDTDLFRPERRSEDCAEGSLRWRMTGGKPHLSAFRESRGVGGASSPRDALEFLPLQT